MTHSASSLLDSESSFIIQAPTVDEDDVEQEAALLRLMGKTPSKALIRKKLQVYGAALFSGELPFASAMPGTSVGDYSSYPSEEVVQVLGDWARTQPKGLAMAVMSFIEDPSEEQLQDILRLIRKTPEAKQYRQAQGNNSFSAMLKNFILTGKGSRSIEELYEYARTVHSAKRPEATVRQALRRLIREGIIEKARTQDGEQIYRIIG